MIKRPIFSPRINAGQQGPTGATGATGDNAYVYIAYASDASGTDFTTTFDANLDYIAIKSTATEIVSPAVGDFTGLWKNYKGATGSQGIQGIQGVQGDDGQGVPYAADTGAADAYAIDVTSNPLTYAAGDIYSFKAVNANTGASTLNVDSLGVKTIKKNASEDLVAGDILAGQIITVIYDGTNFQVVSGSSVDIAADIHAATEKTTPADADELGLIDSAASYVLKRLTWANVKATLALIFATPDGWFAATGTWTASDANTISVAGLDLTGVLQGGDKIKLTNNSATKYFYITTTPVFSTNTTFDVTGETDLVAGSITSPYYSKADNPYGFKKAENYYKARAFRTTTQSIDDVTFTKVQLNGETYDQNANFDSTTNYRYTVPITGYYQIVGKCYYNLTTVNRAICSIYKNGNEIIRGNDMYTGQNQGVYASDTVYLVKGDYIELYTYRDGTGAENLFGDANGVFTYLSIRFVGL